MFDDIEIRYHLPSEIDLDLEEPVILEKQLTGTSEFVSCDTVPGNLRDMRSIRTFVRNVALQRGGEAWRAVTERGEVLYVYSVEDLADELSGKPVITLHPYDQFCLVLARTRMGLPG
jgi:hypothetical protein